MKFKYLLIIIILSSCAVNTTKLENRSPYNTKGFALIYNEDDLKNELIRGKLDNSKIQISISSLPINSLVKIINPATKDSITLKNMKKTKYPEFYKSLITKELAKNLNLDNEIPLVEILEIKKNKSFVAKKAKIFNEEKKISNNAPVANVKISNISKKPIFKKKQKENQEIFILIASFSTYNIAKFLKDRIVKELPQYDIKKLKIKKIKDKEINLISGPYNAVNLVKNDYIQLKKFGFEELNIFLNE